MPDLSELLKNYTPAAAESRPRVFDLSKKTERETLQELFARSEIQRVADDYEEQLREYFAVTNPTLVYTPDFEARFRQYRASIEQELPLWQQGRWVYFPWNSTLAHILGEKEFQTVRTARNKNLITVQEQEKFYNAVIGIAGLSVGNSVALAIALQGGGGRMRLADNDRLALSNTNRIRTGVENLGVLKVEMTARQIYALDPYAEIETFSDGLTEENIARFFEGPPRIDIVIDEIDNLAMKYRIREHAKRLRLPVLMATDNGDDGVVDIERYDLDPDLEYFHGRLGDVSYESFANLSKLEAGRMISRYVGPGNVARRMQESLPEIGKTLVSWPQLGGAALLNGASVAYCVRKIVNNQPLQRERAFLSLDQALDPTYHTHEEKEKRRQTTAQFKQLFDL